MSKLGNNIQTDLLNRFYTNKYHYSMFKKLNTHLDYFYYLFSKYFNEVPLVGHTLHEYCFIMIKVAIKWGKENFDLEVDSNEDSDTFRAQLCSLTGVPVDKQKIMGFKGGLLKTGVNLIDVGLVDGLKVTLIGTAEANQLQRPKAEIIFEEDVVGDKRLKLMDGISGLKSVGLFNLGNTCYMNSVLHFLRPVFGLQSKINDVKATAGLIPFTYRNLMSELKSAGEALSPQSFVLSFKNTHTQFANTEQQDAEEFLSTLLNDLGGSIANNNETATDALNNEFGFTVEHKFECLEDVANATITVDQQQKLSVFCGTPTTAVNHLHEGLRLALEESLTRKLDSIGREVAFRRVTRMASLPKFLQVQMVRFEWKHAHVLAGTEAGKAKICRKISFPVKLDLWEFLTPALKRKLSLVRDILTDRSERSIVNHTVKETEGGMAVEVEADNNKTDEEEEELQEWNGIKAGIPIDTAMFDICSVVTHVGLSADSGHYIGWVRKAALEPPMNLTNVLLAEGGATESEKEPSVEDKWVKFDDDKCTEMPFKETYIEGGHQHSNTAYLLMYRRRVIIPTAKEIAYLKKNHANKMAAESDAQTEEADKNGMVL